MKIDPDGLLPQARSLASPNCDERPPGAVITLLVLHSISLPPGEYGGDAIERLFTNRLDPAAHPYFRDIAGLKLSSHFLVRRRSEEHTSELQSQSNLVCRLLLEKKKKNNIN